MDFIHLKRNLNKDFSAFPSLDIAIIADSSTQLYVQAIRGYAYEFKLNIHIHEYTLKDVYQSTSDLHSKIFHTIIFFFSSEKLLEEFYTLSPEDRKTLASDKLILYKQLITEFHQSSLIIYNLRELNEGTWGNYANKHPASFLFQLRHINLGLMQLASESSNCYVQDLSIAQSRNTSTFFDPRMYVAADMVIGMNALPMVAKETLTIIQRSQGIAYKCLILDLDNTLWGGIVGDIGPEQIEIGNHGIGKAFTLFQLWVRELKYRGILLAICSKNNEAVALQALSHPEMILNKSDFVSFKINWNNKADNIRQIQQELNIGMNSIVFIDDSAFERNLIRKELPDVCVPEMPDDPAEFIRYLSELNLFETAGYTDNDHQRTLQYQQETNRVKQQGLFTDYTDYLVSLNMKAEIGSLTTYTIPRISQLSLRSNQFNLRTVRYSEALLETIAADPDYMSYTISLSDVYGNYGLTAFVMLKKIDADTLFIENMVMSCRVLQRGVEELMFNHIVEQSISKGFQIVSGEFIPTNRNSIVKDLYERLGFENQANLWNLQLRNYHYQKHYIHE